MFQLSPNSVRSTSVSSFSGSRSRPYPSVNGPEIVPVSSTGFVSPRIVMSPRTVTVSPERSIYRDSNFSSG